MSRTQGLQLTFQFCGGFPAGPRQPFPLTNAPIWVNSHHESATLWAFISTKPDPTTFADFNTTANGTSIPLLTNAFQVAKGERCWNVNFEKLNLGLTNGSEITLQLKYDGVSTACNMSPLLTCRVTLLCTSAPTLFSSPTSRLPTTRPAPTMPLLPTPALPRPRAPRLPHLVHRPRLLPSLLAQPPSTLLLLARWALSRLSPPTRFSSKPLVNSGRKRCLVVPLSG